jgi:hypothetical protein
MAPRLMRRLLLWKPVSGHSPLVGIGERPLATGPVSTGPSLDYRLSVGLEVGGRPGGMMGW